MQNPTVWLNRMVKVLAAVSVLFTATPIHAQQLTYLTLNQAYQLAQENYPMVKQKKLVEQTANLNIDNLSAGFLPQFSLSGQSTYQSDVTKIEVPIAGFKIEAPG